MLDSILKLAGDVLTNPLAVTLLVGVFMWVLHAILKDKAALADALLSKGVDVAHAIVSDIAPKTETKIDDQVVIFLKAFKDYFAAHGKVPTPKQEEKAVAMFKAMVRK